MEKVNKKNGKIRKLMQELFGLYEQHSKFKSETWESIGKLDIYTSYTHRCKFFLVRMLKCEVRISDFGIQIEVPHDISIHKFSITKFIEGAIDEMKENL